MRAWTFGHVAPTASAGPVELYVVCNTGDGSATANGADVRAFFGHDARSTLSKPIRLYVDGSGVWRAAAQVSDLELHTKVARWSRRFRNR